MKYEKTVFLKDGRSCLIRGCNAADGEAMFHLFNTTHAETDYLLSYPDENSFDITGEADFLARIDASDNAIELGAFVDGVLVGSAGIEPVGIKDKVKHRAEFGISVLRDYWGLGIGRALTLACIACARAAAYAQLELDAVRENKNALALYESVGFAEYGANPKGFRSRSGRWQELVLMRLDLNN